jgi:hypothetical protein
MDIDQLNSYYIMTLLLTSLSGMQLRAYFYLQSD